MTHTLMVKPDDSVTVWAVFLDEEPLIEFDVVEEGFEIPLVLPPGRHFFFYDVVGAGGTLTLELTGNPPGRIVLPEEAEWPFEVTVPENRTRTADRIYFNVGN